MARDFFLLPAKGRLEDVKTICSISAQRSFIRHWKLISRSAAVVGILLAAAIVLLGANAA
jgi:hypothetical protein